MNKPTLVPAVVLLGAAALAACSPAAPATPTATTTTTATASVPAQQPTATATTTTTAAANNDNAGTNGGTGNGTPAVCVGKNLQLSAVIGRKPPQNPHDAVNLDVRLKNIGSEPCLLSASMPLMYVSGPTDVQPIGAKAVYAKQFDGFVLNPDRQVRSDVTAYGYGEGGQNCTPTKPWALAVTPTAGDYVVAPIADLMACKSDVALLKITEPFFLYHP